MTDHLIERPWNINICLYINTQRAKPSLTYTAWFMLDRFCYAGAREPGFPQTSLMLLAAVFFLCRVCPSLDWSPTPHTATSSSGGLSHCESSGRWLERKKKKNITKNHLHPNSALLVQRRLMHKLDKFVLYVTLWVCLFWYLNEICFHVYDFVRKWHIQLFTCGFSK